MKEYINECLACVCVCAYIYIYIYMHTHTHTLTHTHAHMHANLLVFLCCPIHVSQPTVVAFLDLPHKPEQEYLGQRSRVQVLRPLNPRPETQ